MSKGFVPAGTNGMADYGDLNDPGYQDCSTDCDLYYGVGAPVAVDPVTGLTLYSLVDYLPTHYLTSPVGTTLTSAPRQG